MTKSNLKITLSNHLRRGHHTCSDKDMLKESTLSVIESVSDTVDSMSKFDKEKAAEKVKSILQIAPHPEENGEGFLPSSFSRWVMVGNETDYHPHDYEKYTGEKKVLVLCTEQKYLQCSNGNKFSTGNNPVEIFLPLMHMEQAGIEYEICTPTGRPALMEMWAMPERDLHIQEYFKANFTKFQEPTSLTSIVDTMEDEYVALFIPGGHGAMLGLPENRDVSKLIQWVKEKDLFLIALSHGPVALLAAKELKPHPFQGYKISACPDRTDRTRVKIGFLPGPMPWFMGEKLMDLEVVITNRRVAGNVQKDRKFLTGDGAKAANALGKLAVDCILEELKLSHVEQPEES